MTMACDDKYTNRRYDYGSQTARPATGRQSRAADDDFYQRVSGSHDYEPQTARDYHTDPLTKNMSRGQETMSPPFFRAGRMGAPWRHVRQCLGNLGNHICFMDGTVKQDDMKQYPPYGYIQPSEAPHTYISPRLVPSRPSSRYDQPPRDQPHSRDKYSNNYNTRARKGHRYWHDDRTSGDAK